MAKGLLIVLSGPSGAGKGTVLNDVMKKSGNLHVAVSATTRKPRVGEVDGINYYFKSMEEFTKLLKEDAFIEHQCVYNNYYGTLKTEVFDRLEQGIDVVLEIDVQGAINVFNQYKDAVSIFVCPQDLSVLKERLKGRGTESPETLALRFESSVAEIRLAQMYKYVVVNDNLSKCSDEVLSIIKAEKCLVERNKHFIENLTYGGK